MSHQIRGSGTISGSGHLEVYRSLRMMSLWVLNIEFLGIEFPLIEIPRVEVGLILVPVRLYLEVLEGQDARSGVREVKLGAWAVLGV